MNIRKFIGIKQSILEVKMFNNLFIKFIYILARFTTTKYSKTYSDLPRICFMFHYSKLAIWLLHKWINMQFDRYPTDRHATKCHSRQLLPQKKSQTLRPSLLGKKHLLPFISNFLHVRLGLDVIVAFSSKF